MVAICSKHLLQHDFTTDASGRTWLKPGAVPKSIWPVVSSQCTSSSSIDIFPKQVSVMPKGIASSIDVTGSSIRSSSSRINTDESFNVEDWPSSSSSNTWSALPATVTASENGYESDVFTESVQAKKKRKRKRYVGDLTSSDFSTSEKRKWNFRLMKDTILRQRKLLQNKQRLIRYSRNRIQTQKEFLDMLNQKFNMNVSTESELKSRSRFSSVCGIEWLHEKN
ncbi:unnamed protein product [Acanthoscelides obtectus]|uniref:THAP-type domain-containing protein n=1 Tax=Acanthoscelides obtectus TaxID=200917 RepID=A0A9P0PEQ6_ACAOB|nr:unnamed protein product [Acanthoscelides obtectus]CAK1633720.1 hypothetical protein AOBTE_LOCUS8342 [Acanthoscelides obtectus]